VAVLGTRACPAGFVAGLGSFKTLLTGGALGNPLRGFGYA